MKEKKSELLAAFLAVLAIVVVVVSLFLGKKSDTGDTNVSIVTDASEFFTVNSCIYRVTNYIYKKDADSLMNVLSPKYQKENKINDKNIMSKFPKITQDSTFVSKKMYYTKINDTVTKYYVFGVIRPNIIHDYDLVLQEEETSIYFIVVLDSDKQIFSVEPYDGKIFMDGDKNE